MQYIGARYVTKIYENSLDPSQAEWEASVNYEPLTMVTYNNGSYLSKKAVPASAGNPPSEPAYWVQTGFYNGQIAYLQNQITALDTAVNGEFLCIESAFDTTLSNGAVTKRIDGAAFEALGIDPGNASIIGWSAHNKVSDTWWSNDTYPASYRNVKHSDYSVSVTALAANGYQEIELSAGFIGTSICGYSVTWNSATTLCVTVAQKGSKVYAQIVNEWTGGAITDTGTVTIYYTEAEDLKQDSKNIICPKLRIDTQTGKPFLQVECELPSQYDIGDDFRISIYKHNNVIQF